MFYWDWGLFAVSKLAMQKCQTLWSWLAHSQKSNLWSMEVFLGLIFPVSVNFSGVTKKKTFWIGTVEQAPGPGSRWLVWHDWHLQSLCVELLLTSSKKKKLCFHSNRGTSTFLPVLAVPVLARTSLHGDWSQALSNPEIVFLLPSLSKIPVGVDQIVYQSLGEECGGFTAVSVCRVQQLFFQRVQQWRHWICTERVLKKQTNNKTG